MDLGDDFVLFTYQHVLIARKNIFSLNSERCDQRP